MKHNSVGMLCALALVSATILAGCTSNDSTTNTSSTRPVNASSTNPGPAGPSQSSSSTSGQTSSSTYSQTPASTSSQPSSSSSSQSSSSQPTPGPGATGPTAVNLGSSANYVILAKSGISTVPTSAITGNIAVSPAASTAITGFSLILDSSNQFSTSTQVTGKVYAADYAVPTPATLTTAVGDMQTAYTDAAGRTNPTATELGAGEIGGLTIAPGLYKWGTSVLISTDVTLNGGPNAVWIFQIAGDLSEANGKRVVLSGGAQARNIFWQVAGGAGVLVGTTAHFEGNILAQTSVVLQTGATMNGRALAQTAVTVDSNTIVQP